MSLVDNSLLVYTADNTLHHYLIIPTEETIKLHLCGSISFEGVIAAPGAVRVLTRLLDLEELRVRAVEGAAIVAAARSHVVHNRTGVVHPLRK